MATEFVRHPLADNERISLSRLEWRAELAVGAHATLQPSGIDPGHPALCRMQIGATPVDAWYGIWLTTWPGAEHAAVAMDHLIHGRTGDMEAFDVRMSPSFSFHDVMRNDGVESIRLLGRTYQALKLSHYREGAEGNIYRSVTTGWKDLASGMLLYVTYQHIAGAPEVNVPLLPASIDPSP